MKEYTILVGRPMMDLFNATLEHQINPTKDTAARLEDLHRESDARLNKSQNEQEKLLAEKYGEDTLAFIKSLPNKKWFLVGTMVDFYLKWSVDVKSSDAEFTDNWYVEFFKGKFNHKVSWANGYDGVDMLEEDISHDRVLTLLKMKS